jgi:hypothetical protein
MIINTSIPGWFSERELKYLASVAKLIKPNSTLVEIGSFIGRSSWTLSKNIPSSCNLHCVDTWKIVNNYKLHSLNSLFYGDFKEKIKTFDRAKNSNSWNSSFLHYTQDCNNIKSFEMLSNDYIPDGNVSAVFVDGDHSYKQCKKDLENFSHLDNILYFGDDFINDFKEDVVSAVLEFRKTLPKSILINPPESKLWFLWPTQGYYGTQLSSFLCIESY